MTEQRRLAAIVHADVVGYSLLMGRDDSATLAAFKAHRAELIDPTIARHGGRIANTAGDSLLLEFPSIVAAVRCAIDVQRGMAGRNEGAAREQRIQFRIGINLGDVIVDGQDVHGDGVNVAARLQALADPGGITVSGVVRDQVVDKIGCDFDDLGAHCVKNIARPVQVYRVLLDGKPHRASTFARMPQRLWRRPAARWIVGGAVIVLSMAVAAWVLPRMAARPATPPPLSLAILPFAASPTGSAEQQAADDFARSLAAGLGRIHGIRVISPAATEHYRGKPLDVERAGRELNVRHLVEGRVRRVGERLDADAQVIDASTGAQLTSEPLTNAASDLEADARMALLTRRIYETVFGAEVQRAEKPPPANATAIELVLHAYNAWGRNPVSLDGARDAARLFDQALLSDARLVPAMLGRNATLYSELFLDPHADRDHVLQQMDELTTRAVNVDERNSDAWWNRGVALGLQWRWSPALDAFARSERLDPTANDSIAARAETVFYAGRFDEALALADRAIALETWNPHNIAWPMHTRCRASLMLGRDADAIAACEKAASAHDWWMPHLFMVAAYTHLGNAEKAAAEKAQVQKLRPGISIADVTALRLSDQPGFIEGLERRVLAALRSAGIAEQ